VSVDVEPPPFSPPFCADDHAARPPTHTAAKNPILIDLILKAPILKSL
jgi:hypothetical protein